MISLYIIGAKRGLFVNIFDAHCDVLMKMFNNPSLSFDSELLQLSYGALKDAGKVQCFAIYIPENVHPDMKFMAALSQVQLFHERILSKKDIIFVQSKHDIDLLREGQIGAILTLEGCDCVGNDVLKLQTLLRLGVSSVGLTWNFSNLLADGAMEERGAGLSDFGKQAVRVLNENSITCDVSHLSEHAFWDVIDVADHVIASHSNVYRLCPHPRNLRDEQIKAMIKRNSMIGITFVPQFLTAGTEAAIKDILNHIDYICSLGGENNIGLGSDFDGIDCTVAYLASYRDYSRLINELGKFYPAALAEKIIWSNFSENFYK
ncbi:dipeptidase [Peribacillus sp. B-H-3]|jgi:membrane dipeptidase|uniref:dipeptidase n=1 Tax=Peribacillus sp. B-H-3 TaxID=3400420 RepID=UPI003B01C78B